MIRWILDQNENDQLEQGVEESSSAIQGKLHANLCFWCDTVRASDLFLILFKTCRF